MLKFGRSVSLFVTLYLIVITAVGGGMFYARQAAIDTYGSSDAQGDWETWRSQAEQDASTPAPEAGNVERRVPKSEAPPALVLMKDHFAVCLLFALVMSSALYATLFFFVRGAAQKQE